MLTIQVMIPMCYNNEPAGDKNGFWRMTSSQAETTVEGGAEQPRGIAGAFSYIASNSHEDEKCYSEYCGYGGLS